MKYHIDVLTGRDAISIIIIFSIFSFLNIFHFYIIIMAFISKRNHSIVKKIDAKKPAKIAQAYEDFNYNRWEKRKPCATEINFIRIDVNTNIWLFLLFFYDFMLNLQKKRDGTCHALIHRFICPMPIHTRNSATLKCSFAVVHAIIQFAKK